MQPISLTSLTDMTKKINKKMCNHYIASASACQVDGLRF